MGDVVFDGLVAILSLALIMIVVISIIGAVCGMEEMGAEWEQSRRDENKRRFLKAHPLISDGKVCSIIDKDCPFEYGNCYECAIASSNIVVVGDELEMPDKCSYCGAIFTEDMIKDDKVVCEYCGKIHIIK